jgi:hypothetical protein
LRPHRVNERSGEFGGIDAPNENDLEDLHGILRSHSGSNGCLHGADTFTPTSSPSFFNSTLVAPFSRMLTSGIVIGFPVAWITIV